ncbi:MAG: SatD family protein [Chitinophagaceae bacterium]|nr:SatD family protein [Chitinophagaceae bacterium]
MKQYILMADVIGSGSKDAKNLMKDFKKLVASANKTYAKAIISPLTITLGDEFQGVIRDLETATKIILFLEEFLIQSNKHFKLRYVLNQGEIGTGLNKSSAYEMLGKGLTDARQWLGELKVTKNRFLISINQKPINEILTQSFILYQSIVSEWNNEKDYTLVAHFLKYRDYKIIAVLLQKERSLIWKREKSLKMKDYYAVRTIIETVAKL